MAEIKAYYNNSSERYDQVFDSLYFRIYDAVTWKYLEPYVPSEENKLVLDAAGGTGRWSIRIAKKGASVVLLDGSEGMLAAAKKKIQENGVSDKVSTKRGDLTKTDYADETFDFILCEHALFLFEQPHKVIRELARILKKGAPLVISAQNRYVQSLSTVPNKPNPENINAALKLLMNEEHGHMDRSGKVKTYTWTPDEFKEMLENSGLRVSKIVGKCITMPLRITSDIYSKNKFTQSLFESILKLELALCEKPDALALAGHLQAAAVKP
jgi:ubiquinone/menaquinone biosynthesis C-methylase UbiE